MIGGLPSGITVISADRRSGEQIPYICPQEFTAEQTEGPFYKYGSELRTDFVEGEKNLGVAFTLRGYVFDRECRTIKGAWIDFWHADGKGIYDNTGYCLRGHQFTDERGVYILHTVIPGAYFERTNHIHVKLSKSEELSLTEASGSIVTTQIYFPGAERNQKDGLFNPTMVVEMTRDGDGELLAFFNFKLDQ